MIPFRLVKGLRVLAVATGALSLTHCAHRASAPERSPQALLREVCSNGSDITQAKGFVTMSAKSAEASGRFPGTVEAKSEPATLRVEVTNLTGGTEALISVTGDRYVIEVPGKKKRIEKGYGQWGGLPLRWANALFLGRVPCPDSASLENRGTEVAIEADGALRVKVGAGLGRDEEVFLYRLAARDGRTWPETMIWERRGPFAKRVEFRFHDPEPGTASPRRWEAKGSEGEVKVRWNDRKVERAAKG